MMQRHGVEQLVAVAAFLLGATASVELACGMVRTQVAANATAAHAVVRVAARVAACWAVAVGEAAATVAVESSAAVVGAEAGGAPAEDTAGCKAAEVRAVQAAAA